MSDKEQTIEKMYSYVSEDYCREVIGFDGIYRINNKVEIDYSDKTTECLRVENLTTSVVDNPLTGLKEVTIKLYLKGEDV